MAKLRKIFLKPQSGSSSLPDILRKVSVDVYSNTDCDNSYANAGYAITDNMVCAAIAEGMNVVHFYGPFSLLNIITPLYYFVLYGSVVWYSPISNARRF